VTSDSLAAENVRAGGGFSENRDAAPMSVKGSNSTLANTDTSSAVKLDPAPDAESRQATEDWQEASRLKGAAGLKYPEGMGGQGQHPGSHNAQGYVGGPTSAKGEGASATGDSSSTYEADTSSASHTATSGGETGQGDTASSSTSQTGTSGSEAKGGVNAPSTTSQTGTSGNESSHVDSAPSYVHSNQPTSGKPKGKNITEGGFDDDQSKNASFNSDIGDENDPGRAAENKFQREAAESAGDTGAGPRQKSITGDGQYDVLEDDQGL